MTRREDEGEAGGRERVRADDAKTERKRAEAGRDAKGGEELRRTVGVERRGRGERGEDRGGDGREVLPFFFCYVIAFGGNIGGKMA